MLKISGIPRSPVVLIILDGFGINPSKINNGVAEADTPQLDAYFSSYPHTTLKASGRSVGLPDGQMGNSEVGHLALGSGSIIRQDIVQINDAIENGSYYQNKALLDAIKKAATNKRPLHLMGLVSDGGVHSHLDHLKATIKCARDNGVRPLLHMITDGRDTPPQSALNYLRDIESKLHECGGAIASITGRYYAMDRDNRWERTELAWRAYTMAKGQKAKSAETAIRSAYAAGDNDEFIKPILLPSFTPIIEDDALFFFNFRKDRPRQLVAALGDVNFKVFDRGDAPIASVTCMLPYDCSLNLPYAFEAGRPEITLGEVISSYNLNQFHCAETEKYAHVTYFFNGGRTTPFEGEEQLLIPSPNVATYDQKPSMSAKEVADAVIDAICSERHAFIVVNFANGDMVGHTAKKHAVLEAIETLDREASRVIETAESIGYSVVVTADHGNCEELIHPFTGEPQTQHTTYPVPCMIMDDSNWQLSCDGGLANVAPTILQLMGLTPVAAMENSLLLKKIPGKRANKRASPNKLRVA